MMFFRRHLSASKEDENNYLLEYRFSGYPRKYFKEIHSSLQKRYSISHRNYHYVPHITIAGPIITKNENDLIDILEKIIFKYAHFFHEKNNLIRTEKFIKFDTDEGEILAVQVIPPFSLINLKRELEKVLSSKKNITCKTYEVPIWHTTIWNVKHSFRDNKDKIKIISDDLCSMKIQEMSFILDRISLIKNKKILKEFDLVNLKTLDRFESLNNAKRYSSYLKIKEELEKKGEKFKF